jgi:hypothetical protein
VRIDRAGDLPDLVGHLPGHCEIALNVVADELHIDRRREAEIQDLADDVRGLEEEFNTGIIARQFLAQLRHIPRGGSMMLGV